jgi:hypothetical protein
MHKFGRVAGTPERRAWPSAHHRTGRAYRTACRHTPWSTAKSRECLFAPCAHPTHPPHEGPVRGRTALHAHLRRRLRGATHGARPERLPTPPGRRPTRLVRPPRGDAPHTPLATPTRERATRARLVRRGEALPGSMSVAPAVPWRASRAARVIHIVICVIADSPYMTICHSFRAECHEFNVAGMHW